ncbi:hypothetical protein [Clostridium rectalis]|uniref:hypothetical protein n=1 Tax=Clostridium rectalis TaxID=2040295 RepID=UPI000F63CE3A|nr:hypothetical protein [Clostridium rectalis]
MQKKNKLKIRVIVVCVILLLPGLLLKLSAFDNVKQSTIYILGMIVFSYFIGVFVSNIIYDK